MKDNNNNKYEKLKTTTFSTHGLSNQPTRAHYMLWHSIMVMTMMAVMVIYFLHVQVACNIITVPKL